MGQKLVPLSQLLALHSRSMYGDQPFGSDEASVLGTANAAVPSPPPGPPPPQQESAAPPAPPPPALDDPLPRYITLSDMLHHSYQLQPDPPVQKKKAAASSTPQPAPPPDKSTSLMERMVLSSTGAGKLGPLLTTRHEKDLHTMINIRKPTDACMESLGFKHIVKTKPRSGSTGTGGASNVPAPELASSLREMAAQQMTQAEERRTQIHAKKLASMQASTAAATDATDGDASATATAVPMRRVTFPLSTSEARTALREADNDGQAPGVRPFLQAPPAAPLADAARHKVALCCTLCAHANPQEALHHIAAKVDMWPALPALVVDLDELHATLRIAFATGDKGAATTTHTLKPAEEALWWVLFSMAESAPWAENWKAPRSASEQTSARSGSEPATAHEEGVAAFNAMKQEPERFAAEAAKVWSSVSPSWWLPIVGDEVSSS
jgi:hypothetical protein